MRGWFVKDTGQDMELNGCVPDVTLWPQPGAIPAGKDKQLETAVMLLLDDVQALEKKEPPKLTKASERER